MTETPSFTTISTKLQRIAKLAQDTPQLAFTTLAHHINMGLLHEAYRRTRKDAAAGIDGQTGAEYAKNLEGNLQSLLDRVKSGKYRAPPVRRVHIPKGDGSKTRPIGVPTFEDKVLQRAVVMILEPIYEQDFMDWSYGFRPRRSAHQALAATRGALMQMHGGWVLEVDIASFFDELDHGHLVANSTHLVSCHSIKRVVVWIGARGSIRAAHGEVMNGMKVVALLAGGVFVAAAIGGGVFWYRRRKQQKEEGMRPERVQPRPTPSKPPADRRARGHIEDLEDLDEELPEIYRVRPGTPYDLVMPYRTPEMQWHIE